MCKNDSKSEELSNSEDYIDAKINLLESKMDKRFETVYSVIQ